jgi:hypothetical protein
MAANVRIPELATAPVRNCADERRCLHLRALARIEEIAGFGHAARAYATQAACCCRGVADCAIRSACNHKGTAQTAPAGAIPLILPREGQSRAVIGAIHEASLIRFDRGASIDRVSDAHGNHVERRPLKLEALPASGDPLRYLYDYWCELRSASTCRFENIDTVHLDRAGIIGKMHVVDVNSSDPGDFRYELFGYAVPVGQYETPRAHPVGIWSASLLADYNTVRITAVPRLHRVRARLNNTYFHYTRLILPFLNAVSRVNRLAIMIRQEAGDGLEA